MADGGAPGIAKYLRDNLGRWKLGARDGGRPVSLPPSRRVRFWLPVGPEQAGKAHVLDMLIRSVGKQSLGVYVGGKSIASEKLAGKWQALRYSVPAGSVKGGLVEVRLLFRRTRYLGKVRTPAAIRYVRLAVAGTAKLPEAEAALALALAVRSGSAVRIPKGGGLDFYVTPVAGLRLTGKASGGTVEVLTQLDGKRPTRLGGGKTLNLSLDGLADKPVRLMLRAKGGEVKLTGARITGSSGKRVTIKAPPKRVVFWLIDALRADKLKFYNRRGKGRPQVLNLKQILEAYLEHRREIITRRTEHQLRKAQARLHIIEGLLKAQEHMDRVIQLIRESESADTASLALQAELELSPLQAKAILDMRLAKLARLERQALHDEHGELTTLISRLEAILADPAEVDQLIRTELEGLATKYGDARRTEILEMEEEIDIADLIPKHEVVITKTAGGYIKRLPLDTYRAQHRGGVGLRGVKTKDEDYVIEVYVTHSHDVVLFFSNFGRLFWLPAYRLPETGRHARGTAIVNLFPQLEPEEKILCLIPVEEFAEDRYLVFATTNGQIKKTVLAEYRRSRRQGLKAVVLKEGHELVGASISDGDDYVVIATANGKAIRFHESEVRSMGRVAAGVRGMKLREGDRVVSMALVKEEAQLLSITENGFGKRTPVEAYAPKHRGGMGVITIQTNERNGNVVGVLPIEGAPDLIISTVQGMVIRTPVEGISESGRAAMGVRLMRPKEDDRIVAVALYAGNGDEEKEDGNDEGREGDTEEAEPKDENEASTPSEPDPTGSD